MTHSAGPPSPGQRHPEPRHWLRPRGSRFLVLGVCMAVGGLAGGVRSAWDGERIGAVLGTFGLGILGVLVVVSHFLGPEDPRGRR
ncbi:hypothetical protein AV521_26350 [Streptomyces sp. IMTB 2501]|uniref:hypothetical protein n=1 Tax=Streptomyces sp. IMTB 2501 TaxID=1776340 RepID=UPI00096C3CFD|nr:hypothetical protein [Streptomyces sp. IMTB 2501]OLZ66918.1 hypothetical protein AV521_26350 [Streptomyces sp. IMTB 2501]